MNSDISLMLIFRWLKLLLNGFNFTCSFNNFELSSLNLVEKEVDELMSTLPFSVVDFSSNNSPN